jgi:hypothetical protein
MPQKIARLRSEAREKWRLASGKPEAAEGVRDVVISEAPPVPKKPRRVFEV